MTWPQPDSSDTPLGHLSPQDWLDDPATQRLFDVLESDGGQARFVGGCVRDAVLHLPVKDLDVATTHHPTKVMELLARHNIKAIPTGLAHGTVTAIIDNRTYEITTLRRDVATDGRHAQVEFTNSWQEDASRRDFTINTLTADRHGWVWDYFSALMHLSVQWVGFVGNPEARIEEDVLRILRFFRFTAHYGNGKPEKWGLDACRKLAPLLTSLSAERIRDEILKLLMAPDPSPVITIMMAEGIFAPILPELGTPDRLKVLAWLESRALGRPDLAPDALRRLCCLLPPDAAIAQNVALKLRLSNAQSAHLETLAELWPSISPDTDPHHFRLMLHQHGPDLLQDAVLLSWSDKRRITVSVAPTITSRWVALLDQIQAWEPIPFPLRGQDALDLGCPPGPTIGKFLALVETWWRNHDFTPDRDACLQRLREIVGEG